MLSYHALLKIKIFKNIVNMTWARDIYPELYSILQTDRFKILLNIGYMNSNVSSGKANDVLDIIKRLIAIDTGVWQEMKEILLYPL